MAILDEVLALNQAAPDVQDPARSASVEAKRKFCVITCVDPRLVRFFSVTLGLDRGDAVIIRVPGAVVTTGHADALRAVAAAVYINGATEFLVLGHTDCGTTRIDAAAVTSEMQRRGVKPSSMPGGVREFLGAVGDLRSTLKASAAAIRGAPFIPRDVLVHVGIIDIVTGKVEMVERGEPFLGQAVAQSSGDALSYTAGPSAVDLSPLLGGGEALLAHAAHSIFTSDAALVSSQAPFEFAGLSASALPPGWAEGSAALVSSAMPNVSAVELSTAQVPTPEDIGSGPLVPPSLSTSPPPLPARAREPSNRGDDRGARGSANNRQKRTKARTQTVPAPAASANRPAPAARTNPALNKVHEFYRLEFPLDERKRIGRALAEALNQGQGSDQLLKIAIRPVLESGQKRYKVLDELIATKTWVEKLPPDEAYAVLSELIS